MPVDLLDGIAVEDEADGILVVVPDALTGMRISKTVSRDDSDKTYVT
jgi:hypothetical protein